MLADFTVETSTTQGAVLPYALAGAYGNYYRFRESFATGALVPIVAKTLEGSPNGAKFEKGYGILTHADPDTISRLVILQSSQGGAPVSWESTDVYAVYSAPILEMLGPLLDGNQYATRPGWSRLGFGWFDTAATWTTRILDKFLGVTAADQTTLIEVEKGRYEAVPGMYLPQPGKYWVDKGANSYAATADDVGHVIALDLTAADRTLSLPPLSGLRHGFPVHVVGYGSTSKNVILAPNGTDKIDTLTGGTSLTLPPNQTFSIQFDAAKNQWRTSYNNTFNFAQYTEALVTVAAPSTTSGVITFDLTKGLHHAVPVDANITSMVVSGAVAGKVNSFTAYFTANGTGYTQAYPTNTTFHDGGAAPTHSTANGKITVITFISKDGGSHWMGFLGGAGFG